MKIGAEIFDSKNQAAILRGKRDATLICVNDPPLSTNQVRVAIQTSAICGTQLGEWNMSRGPDAYLPHCFGHEAVGSVLEIGEEVDGLKVGDRVIVSWMKSGPDYESPPQFIEESGETINFGRCCTFVRRGVFPSNRVFKIDKLIDSDTAALLGCALLTAYAAVKCATQDFTRTTDEIVILGAGGIGLSVATICKAYGLVACCVDTPTVVENLSNEDFDLEFITTTEAERLEGDGFPIVIVCSGAPLAFELAEALLPKNGGDMFVVGNPPYGKKIGFDVKPLLYGRKILGIGEKDISLPEDLYELVDQVKCGRLEGKKLVRQRFSLLNIQSALEASETGFGGRTLIDID